MLGNTHIETTIVMPKMPVSASNSTLTFIYAIHPYRKGVGSTGYFANIFLSNAVAWFSIHQQHDSSV